MPLNPYHNHYVSVNEQDLTDQLIIEAIQMKGLLVKYLPRTHNNYNALYGEDPTSSFESAVDIEMYPTTVQNFDGSGDMFSRFGLQINSSATFVLNKTRFKEEFPNEIRPKEGDVLLMPYTNAILEIKFVDHESPFFEQGRQYVYELKTELFELSHETVATGDEEVDDLIAGILDFNAPTETEPYGDNDVIETEFPTSFDPNNPFGVN
jgi:hypothetical protein